jgi:hypothetical protein
MLPGGARVEPSRTPSVARGSAPDFSNGLDSSPDLTVSGVSMSDVFEDDEDVVLDSRPEDQTNPRITLPRGDLR